MAVARMGSLSGARSRSFVTRFGAREFQTVRQAFDGNALQPFPSSFGLPGSLKPSWASALGGKSGSWSCSIES
jgi:hypothetical protein